MPSDNTKNRTPMTTPAQPKLLMSNWLSDRLEHLQSEQDEWERLVDRGPALKALDRMLAEKKD